MRSLHALTLLLVCAPSSVVRASGPSARPPAAPVDDRAPAADPPPVAAGGIAVPIILPSPLVISGTPGTPPVNNMNGTTNNPFLQIAGGDAADTGYLEFKYGADAKGIYNVIVKTRGVAMNDYAAVQSGDRLLTDALQAGSGGQAGHAGTETWVVDGTNIVPGEVNGRWSLATGVGISSGPASRTPYPTRYGVMQAIVANSFQQVYFPGGIQASAPSFPAGSNFGGWVVIGAGAAGPGFGALKFLAAGAATLATPEPGAFEVDANATPYFTRGDAVRRSFDLSDTGTPTVAAGAAAGRGASARVDAGGSAGSITLVTGAAPSAGTVLTLTYAHPYAVASYPVFSFANAAGPAAAAQLYATGTRAGFTLTGGAALAANTTYVFTYQAPGR